MKKILFLLITISFLSCSEDDIIVLLPETTTPDPVIETIDFDALNETEILAYLSDNNLTAEKTASGLYYIIPTEGTGASPLPSSNVTIAYEGYFVNGTVFDQSTNATFFLSQLIPGFSQGTQLLKEGGSGTFILPSRLAYGTRGQGSIQPGDVIIFDINLISVN